jgi:drug/metabolite transporter (DMT)-like permease
MNKEWRIINMNNKHTIGIMWAVLAALISGVAVFTNALVVKGIDPLVHTTIKNSVVGLMVLGIIILSRERQAIKKLTKHDWLKLAAIALIGGSLSFALFFTGLKQIGASEGQLLNKTLVIWVTLLAIPLLKEKLNAKMVGAIILLYISALFGGGWKSTTLVTGHLLVMAATIMWAVETVIVKKTLKTVPLNIALGARMGIGSLILLVILSITNKAPLIAQLSATQWGLLLMVGLILFGYTMSWYRALNYLPATVVTTILAGAVVITTLLDAIFTNKTLDGMTLIKATLVISGIYLAITSLKANRRGQQPIPAGAKSN